MNDLFFYFDKIRYTLHNTERRVVLTITLPIILIGLISVFWFFMEKREQNKMAKNYILEVQNIENMEEDSRALYIENIFNNSKNSLYKVYFGTKLINEIHVDNADKAINVARQILSIPNLPKYISDAISTKLSYIYLGQLTKMSNNKQNIADKSKEITEYLNNNINDNGIFYPLQKEALLEIGLLNENVNDYKTGIKDIKDNTKNLPISIKNRLEEVEKIFDLLEK